MRRHLILAAILFSTSGYLFAQDSITSFFDSGDDEGWIVVGDAQGASVIPDYFASGGNPPEGGYVSARDDVTGGVWYWQAPAKFLGNVSGAYGGTLSFDLKQSIFDTQFNAADIILQGSGLTLVFNTPHNPGTAWTPYSILLNETAGWRKTTLTGVPPTQTEMLAVLSSLQILRIRGEYRTGADRGDLDNVVLTYSPFIANAGPDRAINSGQSVTIGGAPTAINGTAPYSYSWSPADDLDNPNIANPTASPSSTTIYSVTVIDANNVTSTDGVVVTVNETPPVQCSASFFDSDDEGWIVVGDAQGASVIPDHFPSGGNPPEGGYISALDDVVGGVWYWQAPAKFLGNVSCSYGGILSFDLKQSINNTQFNAADIILVGGGLTLVFNTPNNPGTAWTCYSIPLNETAGWRKTTVTGVPPTQTEMLAVLSSLQKLQIRGEYRTGADRGDLDNVVLTCNPLPTATVSRDATVCAGTSAIISADLTGAAPWSIMWSDGWVETGINSSSTTRVVSPTNTTTYTITNITNANGCSNSGSGSATITVNPLPTATVSGVAAICAGGLATISVDLTGTAPWSLTWSDDDIENGIMSSPATRVVSPASTTIYTVTVVSDANCTGTSSGSATVTIRASDPPVIGTIIVPVNPTLINTAINASADFTADCDNDDHSATWDWGDNTTSEAEGTVDQSGNSVTGSHSYTAAGVYTVTLTVTDGAGNSGEGSATAFVVIYDPTAGFVVGAGWIMSPPGAYVADPSVTGKANFGFVSKYQQGNSIPDGNTTFHFNAASFKFKSTSYEWLVIAGPNAKYKGEGIINNSGNYGFMLTARDGEVNGGGGVDKFRIKIWDKDNNDALVYDNQMTDPDDADATDAIEGGSITIHSSNASKESAGASEPVPVSFMLEQNYPNPFNPSTMISFALPQAGRATLKIYSELGQLVVTLVDGEMNVGRYAISWDGRNQAGAPIASGAYLYQLVVQGSNGEAIFAETKRMTLVK